MRLSSYSNRKQLKPPFERLAPSHLLVEPTGVSHD